MYSVKRGHYVQTKMLYIFIYLVLKLTSVHKRIKTASSQIQLLPFWRKIIIKMKKITYNFNLSFLTA